jgi:hypothetical protein
LKSKNKTVKEGCQESERREREQRVDQIIDLVRDIDYGDSDIKAANILSFAKSNLTIDEIAKLVEPFKESYKDHKNAQVYRSGLY